MAFTFFGIHFYKTMYTDQGYLTNTLPVTPHQLLVSKIFVSGTWNLIIMIALYGSMIALLLSLFSSILAGTLEAEGYRSIWEVFGMIFSEMGPVYEEMGFDLAHFGITALLMVIVTPFAAMTILFGSLTLGQLSKKYKALMGILAYFGVCLVNMIIAMIAQFVITFKYSMDIMSNEYVTMNMNITYDISIIVVVIMAVILYIAGHSILSKKLNMD